jgi:superfamily II DNA or RNA helicase
MNIVNDSVPVPVPTVTPIITIQTTIQIAAQSTAVQPERFQTELITGMTRTLLRTPSPPCLLRAPTGSGKTYVISQVLERISEERNVLWVWFVPFVTLVQQTEDALRANATSLAPCSLNAGRNQEAHPGMVLLSTAQGVSRAQARTKGYDADGDDDSSKQVLIFKQSAGTGFDAPRAFVLASTKPVNDADFAMQFIGRVMRVARPVRDAFGKPKEIPADLNTAYVYLGNAQAQAGFESAVKASTEVKSQLEGQTEKLETRQTVSGAVVYSNRPTDQEPVAFDIPLPDTPEVTGLDVATPAASGLGAQGSLFNSGAGGIDVNTVPDDVWGGSLGILDVVAPDPNTLSRTRRKELQNREERMAELDKRGLRAYRASTTSPSWAVA